MAIQFHFVDYVVHGWYVARASGVLLDIPADVVSAAAPIAFAVPDGEMRSADNSPFAPALPASQSGNELDRMLRSPRQVAGLAAVTASAHVGVPPIEPGHQGAGEKVAEEDHCAGDGDHRPSGIGRQT